MNKLLIIVCAVLLVSMIVGIARGFVKTLFGLFGMALVLVLTVSLAPKAATALKNNEKFHTNVETGIEEHIAASVASEGAVNLDVYKENNKASTVDIAGFKIPADVLSKALDDKAVKNAKKDMQTAIVHTVSVYLADRVINVGSYLVIFVGLYIIVWILAHVLGLISKLPVLNAINRFGGAVCGLIGGLVAVWIIFLLITMFIKTPLMQSAMEDIGKSQVLTFLYSHAPLIGG